MAYASIRLVKGDNVDKQVSISELMGYVIESSNEKIISLWRMTYVTTS